jgi:hypothetical protein
MTMLTLRGGPRDGMVIDISNPAGISNVHMPSMVDGFVGILNYKIEGNSAMFSHVVPYVDQDEVLARIETSKAAAEVYAAAQREYDCSCGCDRCGSGW